MRHKGRFANAFFVLLLLCAARLTLHVQGDSQDLEFEVLASGDISGYTEETYIIARTEVEWEEILENHSAPILYPEEWIEFWENHSAPVPSTLHNLDIDFSKKMIICAFMGEHLTAGYSISVESIWVDDTMHVDIVTWSPSEDLVVAQVITYPYVFASVERNDMNIVFEVTEEDGSKVEYVLSEMSAPIFVFVALMTFFLAVVASTSVKALKKRMRF